MNKYVVVMLLYFMSIVMVYPYQNDAMNVCGHFVWNNILKVSVFVRNAIKKTFMSREEHFFFVLKKEESFRSKIYWFFCVNIIDND